MSKKYINIEEVDNNVVLSIDVPENEEMGFPTLDDVLMALKTNKVEDYDSNELRDILKKRKLTAKHKIKGKMLNKDVDEVAFLDFDKNNLNVTIEFKSPENNGKSFGKEEINKILGSSAVVFGIDTELISRLGKSKEYNRPYLIAKGKEKEDGIDGKIEFHIETEKKTLKPLILEDGRVDYRNIDLYASVDEGEKIFSVIPPTNGINGMDVKGRVIEAIKGKPVTKLPLGKNTKMSKDGTYGIATLNGQVEYANNKIDIVPILELNGDVDNSTGNINFNGDVIINGGIKSGFTVKSKGTLEVKGTVEGAEIFATEDCILSGGIMGGSKAKVTCLGNVAVKFVDNAKITAAGNITADSIMHSKISTDKSVFVEGKHGLIVGGSIQAADEVRAVTIGSAMATNTKIVTGILPSIVERYKYLTEKYEEIEKRILKTNQGITILKNLGDSITSDKKKVLARALYSQVKTNNEKKLIIKELKELKVTIEKAKGKVLASKVIHPGVKITIGNARINCSEKIRSSYFINEDGRIVSIPL